jgi:hypothetical protein
LYNRLAPLLCTLHPGLEVLSLDYNRLGDEGARYVAAMITK